MSTSGRRFATRLRDGPPLLMDGALGTEIERRGVPSGLPLWSARALLEAPDVVAAIHRDYVASGVELLTAATFRTQRRTLERAGLVHGAPAAELAASLTGAAVELARDATRDATNHTVPGAEVRVLVAGSQPPLEDCYRPDLVPDAAACEREHREHAENLAAAGVDVIAVETMNTIREACSAARAAAATGIPHFVGFVCDEDARLLSGEPLAEALTALAALGESAPDAVGVNCVPPRVALACLTALADTAGPFFVYAHLGEPTGDGWHRSADCSPEVFAESAGDWLSAGACMVGGCCGTTPDHLRALAARMRKTGAR